MGVAIVEEERKRASRKGIWKSVEAGDVIDDASADTNLISSVSPYAVCQAGKFGWNFLVLPWLYRSAIAIKQTLAIIARWMGLDLHDDEKQR